jgi:uncharacterized protein
LRRLFLTIVAFASPFCLPVRGQGVPQVPSSPQANVAPQGTFSGSLQAGDAELHILLHLSRNSAGDLRATLDSLEQGVFAIEASHVSYSAGTLKVEVSSVGARYEGKVAADQNSIEGDWFQGAASLPLHFKRETGAVARKPSDAFFPIEGLWQGAIEAHGLRLRFQLHISHDTADQLIAALDSLDQAVAGLPATRISLKESTFHFEIPSLGGIYEGTLDPAKNTIHGTWSQTSVDSLALDFVRSDQTLELRRPQTPTKPYPYREEEVSFTTTAGGDTLSGTLTLPKGTGPFPAVLLLSGSGPHDRDETLFSHKPFLVIADALTRRGFAVLRYDKRGVGKSTGNPDMATTLDLAADAQAALALLRARKDIDANRIGLLGHSEGAMIGPYLAAHDPKIAWLVLLATPATKGEDTLIHQSELIGRVGGLTDEQLEETLSFDRDAYQIVRQERDSAVLAQKITALVKETGLDSTLPPSMLETQLRTFSSPWFRFFLDYDPLPALQAVKCPVLALYGQKDLQVPPKANAPVLRKALQEAGNTHAEIREFSDLNHLFQHCYSGAPSEYSAIEETISPEVLTIVTDWIASQANPQK